MIKVKSTRKLLLPLGLLCFTMLIPLLVPSNIAQAATIPTPTISTEDKTSEVKLNVKKKSLVTDTTFGLVLYNLKDSYKVTFKSSDNDIASVDKDGVISALKVGSVDITVTVKENGKTIQTLTCDITVGVPAVSITFNAASSVSILVGKSTLLETIITPNTTVEIPKFSSADPSIATVSSSGRVTGKSAGTTYIFGTLANGQYAKIAVTVTEESETPTPTATPIPTPTILVASKR